jgi:hypothetical protein
MHLINNVESSASGIFAAKPFKNDLIRKTMRIFILLFTINIVGLSMGFDAVSTAVHRDDFQAIKVGSLLAENGSQNESYNSSYYYRSLKSALDQYEEDHLVTTRTLNDYVSKNISAGEALVNTTSILMLNSMTLENMRKLNPPENYSNYQSDVINALTEFQYYLWNLAKFYETRKVDYVLEARKRYNISRSYYTKGLNASEVQF